MLFSDAIWNEVLEVGNAEKKWNQVRGTVPSDAIWNDGLEVGTAEKKMKSRWLNSAFCGYLKPFLKVGTAD